LAEQGTAAVNCFDRREGATLNGLRGGQMTVVKINTNTDRTFERMNVAIDAGYARRGFLRGVYTQRGCKPAHGSVDGFRAFLALCAHPSSACSYRE
jgi:hypothetical protein